MKTSNKGFTIMELMIATVIFSVVLLGSMGGFLGIGRLYYKGVTIAQTGDTTRQIMTDLVDGFRVASSVNTQGSDVAGWTWKCIGGNRYTFQIWNQVTSASTTNPASPSSSFGLIRDRLPGNTSCDSPANLAFNNPVEMLGENMRLAKFSLALVATTNNYYTIEVKVAYGDTSSLSYNGSYSTAVCSGNSQESEFCSVNYLATSTTLGLNP